MQPSHEVFPLSATGSPQSTGRTFRFGPFELSESDGELRKNGSRLKLQEQPFRVLRELVSNAGKVVSREELQQKLWSEDTFVDFDTGLNTAIRKLRQALNDDADQPRYIETLARRGYRFIAPVAVATPAISDSVEPIDLQQQVPVRIATGEPPVSTPPLSLDKAFTPSAAVAVLPERSLPALTEAAPEEHRTKWKWVAIGAVAAALIVSLAFWLNQPPREPVVEAINQLTDDQMGKIYVQTDGARVYFNEDRQGSLELAQVSVKGGPVSTIPTEVLSPEMTGISPDASSLLVLQGGIPVSRPLWDVPLPAGAARRISNLEAHEGSVTSDGRLLLCNVADLLIAEKDGSNPRKIVTLKEGHFGGAEMSPDGRRIVFTLYGPPELYVMNSDGSGMRPLAKNSGPGGFCCARWTPDGKYIVFSTRFPNPRQDLWYLRMSDGWLQSPGQPKRLTAGPLSYWMPAPSRDGKSIFGIGTKLRSELFRYDLASRSTVPFLPGVFGPTYSSDGKWMAYTSPDRSAWRSRTDGSERLQLTFPPLATSNLSISPDGKWVAYTTGEGVLVVSGDGGVPRKVIDHPVASLSWSPDTNLVVFTDGKESWQTPEVKLLDLRNGQVSQIPGVELNPQWIAPGKIVAARRDMLVLQIYDVSTKQWSDLTKPEDGPVVNWAHAPDFSFFYYTTSGQNARLVRVRSSDLRSEVVASRKDIHLPVGSGTTAAMGVAPDGSPLFIFEVGTQEIYALSVKWP
jgi:DNA-binding winged helix-turn-helix (wHTH) protein/Tol biopolymer transport system component